MMKAYEYRIYPTSQQEEIFNQTLGLCRLYWNTVVFNKNQDHNFQIEGYKQIFTKYKPEALEWSKCLLNTFGTNMVGCKGSIYKFFQVLQRSKKRKIF